MYQYVNPDSSIIKEYESMQELAEDIATRTRVGIGLPVIGKGVDIVDITLTECDI
jgi:hypothetical protein